MFDRSAFSTPGVSLNDTLHTRPKLQEDLFDILLRFRSHQYVLTGDIDKMYRQILIRPEDRKYQLILWRNFKGEFDTYQLNTVTFGLSASPTVPKTVGRRRRTVLQRDFYVDDVFTGADTKEVVLSNK